MIDLHPPQSLQPTPPSSQSFDFVYPSPSHFDWSSRLGEGVRDLQALRLHDNPHRSHPSQLAYTPPLSGRFRPQQPWPHTSTAESGPSGLGNDLQPSDMNSAGHAQYPQPSAQYASYAWPPPTSECKTYSSLATNPRFAPHSATKINSRPLSRPESPIFQTDEAPSRRGSQNGIVSYLQIPSTISSSRGSLAEFAAQITCLFWFESSATLIDIEDCETSPVPATRLVAEAIPATGFLKWVTTILSTTQVTQNVILLAVLFIYRLKKQNPTVKGKPGSEFRLLTVALMLGNKFLDDNTYTNKTWAEVSGISVQEIHVMEVEFLSHMKYNLYTSKEEWYQWHTLLGRFWTYFDRASRKLHEPVVRSLRPPTLQIPHPLPSPPHSTNTSPPFVPTSSPVGATFPNASFIHAGLGHSTASPARPIPDFEPRYGSRKRSIDEHAAEPPSKRQHYGYHTHPGQSRTPLYTPVSQANGFSHTPNLPMPTLPNPAGQSLQSQTPISALTPISGGRGTPSQQLPPFNWTSGIPLPPSAGIQPGYQGQGAQAVQPRRQTPLVSMGNEHPTYPSTAAHSNSQIQLSPSHFLTQRTSPYRPVRNISTLLVPPPSGQMHQPSHHIPHDQMHWQPLCKYPHERRTGRVPYLHREAWPETHQVENWPSLYESNVHG